MPDHLQKQIRDAAVTAVTGLSTTGSRVTPAAIWPTAEGADPELLVFTDTEASEMHAMGAGKRAHQRELSLVIEGRANGSAAEDALYSIQAEVEAAVLDDSALLSLTKSLSLTATEKDRSVDGSRVQCNVSMTFTAVYRTAAADPTTAA